MKKRLLCLVLCLALLPLGAALADSKTDMTDNWYEIFVRSFYDSDGDRVGDLNGITAKTLCIAIDSDILFPVSESRRLAEGIPGASLEVITSDFGHDGFLLESEQITKCINKHFDLCKF